MRTISVDVRYRDLVEIDSYDLYKEVMAAAEPEFTDGGIMTLHDRKMDYTYEVAFKDHPTFEALVTDLLYTLRWTKPVEYAEVRRRILLEMRELKRYCDPRHRGEVLVVDADDTEAQ